MGDGHSQEHEVSVSTYLYLNQYLQDYIMDFPCLSLFLLEIISIIRNYFWFSSLMVYSTSTSYKIW